jgi:mono/diheme cytochrome c family protein
LWPKAETLLWFLELKRMQIQKYSISLALAFMVLTLALSGYNPQPTQAEPEGKAVYERYCQSCHRKGGNGFFKLYPPLNDTYYLNNDSLMVAIITQGLKGPITVSGKDYDREMPAVEKINLEEISAVVNFVRKEFINSSKTLSPQSVKEWLRKTQ